MNPYYQTFVDVVDFVKWSLFWGTIFIGALVWYVLHP